MTESGWQRTTAFDWQKTTIDPTAACSTRSNWATSFAKLPVFAMTDPGKSLACSNSAPALTYSEQARNQRSSPVPSLICTGSSSLRLLPLM